LRIHWYPGHMSKAKRIIKENLKMVDLVIELRDARIPKSSINPEFQWLCKDKKQLILLNKSDLADPGKTQEWLDFFTYHNQWGRELNCLNMTELNNIKKEIIEFAEQRQKMIKKQRGIYKTIRAMIIGIPNVGKSTFINGLAGGSKTRVGAKPGVTRGKQWIKIHPYLELLDTPGLLWPKQGDETAMLHLAYIGSIKDDILDLIQISGSLLDEIISLTPHALKQRYNLDDIDDIDIKGYQLLEVVCLKRGWIGSGGIPDMERGARHVLDDYRSGKLGRVTLELP
jgi:ribosome biogenesis GTPase A